MIMLGIQDDLSYINSPRFNQLIDILYNVCCSVQYLIRLLAERPLNSNIECILLVIARSLTYCSDAFRSQGELVDIIHKQVVQK